MKDREKITNFKPGSIYTNFIEFFLPKPSVIQSYSSEKESEMKINKLIWTDAKDEKHEFVPSKDKESEVPNYFTGILNDATLTSNNGDKAIIDAHIIAFTSAEDRVKFEEIAVLGFEEMAKINKD